MMGTRVLLLLSVLLPSCSQQYAESAPRSEKMAGGGDFASAPMMEAEEAMDDEGSGYEPAGARPVKRKPAGARAPSPSDAPDAPAEARRWFPEAFLWAPEVVTSETGDAALSVTVPDTLTTWRVLGLAHDAVGRQAGAVHTFRGSLPTYVELRLPPQLTVGDQVEIPVQVVHEGSDALSSVLRVQALGSATAQQTRRVSLSNGERLTQALSVEATQHGVLDVMAALEDGDALSKQARVRPAGQPVVQRSGGLVSDAVTLPVRGGADEQPSLDVWVYSGPLSLLQGEIERLSDSVSPWSGAYGWALASHLESLADAGGVSLDADVVRKVRLIAWQRLRREARAATAWQAMDLLLGLGEGVEGEPSGALSQRLVRLVRDAQRADGTWSPRDSATLQHVIIGTAVGALALPESESAARTRATGALERYAKRIEDPFTAAVVASTGLLGETQQEVLLQLVRDSMAVNERGQVLFTVPPEVVNLWGVSPRPQEFLAWAAAALVDEGPDVSGPLVAELLSSYDVARGFGAGAANPVVLQVLSKALPGLTGPASVRLVSGDTVLTSADMARGGEAKPVLLSVSDLDAAADVRLVVDPPASGLGWTAVHRRWVPWSDAVEDEIALSVRAPAAVVGEPSPMTIACTAVVGGALQLQIGLPPGAPVDLDDVRASGRIADAYVTGDVLYIETVRLQTGERLSLSPNVTPGFRGTMSTPPHRVGLVGGDTWPLRPTRWRVR